MTIPNNSTSQHKKVIFPKSPLRYPGGKSRAVQSIIPLIPQGTTKMLSPFLGGGSIEIAAAHSGIKVFASDAFDDLYTFWTFLLADANLLANEVAKYHPLSKTKFYELQKDIATSTGITKAAEFFVLNRSSFSGSTLSGGMSPNHPRFNEACIERLRSFKAPNLFVEKKDFQQALLDHPTLFAYLDPPYLIKNTLYGVKGDMHKGFDHEKLAQILSKRSNWILSYNDCPEVRSFYQKFHITTPAWAYGMSKDKGSKEVLIFSPDIKVK